MSGVAGLVVGFAVVFLVAVAFGFAPALRESVAFSALYFFIIGVVRGPNAGFFAGEALSAVARIGVAQAGAVPCDDEHHGQPRAWSSFWLLVVWLALAASIAWLA